MVRAKREGQPRVSPGIRDAEVMGQPLTRQGSIHRTAMAGALGLLRKAIALLPSLIVLGGGSKHKAHYTTPLHGGGGALPD